MQNQEPQHSEPLVADDPDPLDAARMSFGDHLEELRSCLVRALIGVALAAALALLFGKTVLAVIFWPLFMVQNANGMQARLQSLSPTDAFAAYFKMSLLAGFIVAMPWVLHQAWRFVASGLYPRERQFATKLTWASSALFLVGVVFLYFLVLPIILQFFITFNREFDINIGATPSFYRSLLAAPEVTPAVAQPESSLTIPIFQTDPGEGGPGLYVVEPQNRLVVRSPDRIWSMPLEPGATAPAIHSEFAIEPYISFVLQLGLAFGLAFETPLVVYFLAWTNLVSVSTMASSRRYVVFGIVVVAAVLTPPDVLSQSLLAVPMYLLFELGIYLARLRERKIEKTI